MTATSTSVPVPAPAQWTWGPSKQALGGYGGTCDIGPLTFNVAVNHRYSDGWELRGTCTLAAATMASQNWEADSLACTPEGIVAELARRDVLSQLAATARHRVADAARLLKEFDVLASACNEAPPPSDSRN